jgi:hypothetical protein
MNISDHGGYPYTGYVEQIFNIHSKDKTAEKNQRNVFSLFVTGGGISSLAWLFTVPGASRCLKSSNIPYSRSSLTNLLSGGKEEEVSFASYCSQEVAEKLAETAFQNAIAAVLEEEGSILNENRGDRGTSEKRELLNIFGVGCTAALATSIPKKGDHRCYIALYSPEVTLTCSIFMDKEVLTRAQEDKLCSEFLLHVIGKHCKLEPLLSLPNDACGNQKFYRYELSTKETSLSERIEKTIDKRQTLLLFPKMSSSGACSDSSGWISVYNGMIPKNSLVFPGSFNPLHHGHLKLLKSALNKAVSINPSKPPILVVFEISAVNADKPSLAVDEIVRRIQQFSFQNNDHFNLLFPSSSEVKLTFAVAITTTPYFVQKSSLFPSSYFLVGTDTLERLLDPKYYVDNKKSQSLTSSEDIFNYSFGKLTASMSTIFHNNCKFIIGGRIEQKKKAVEEHDKKEVTSPVFHTLSTVLQSNKTADIIYHVFPNSFHEINENDFREDISSSEIRLKLKKV